MESDLDISDEQDVKWKPREALAGLRKVLEGFVALI